MQLQAWLDTSWLLEGSLISAKLSSCLDQLHSILGENLHEPTAVSAVIQCNYDVERALDQIFSQGNNDYCSRLLTTGGLTGADFR